MACFFKICFQRLNFISVFPIRFLGIFVFLFNIFSVPSSFASISPQEGMQLLQIFGQLRGKATAECGSEEPEMKPANEDFCSGINVEIVLNSTMCNLNTALAAANTNPLPCSETLTNIDEIMNAVEAAFENTLENGDAVCHCCMVPSACLLGGIGQVANLLRMGNYAGLLMGLNNNKLCAAIEKSQHASMGIDTFSGGKCLLKGGRCKEMHGRCVEKIESLISNIETAQTQCNPNKPPDCSAKIADLEDYIEDLNKSSHKTCGLAVRAGTSQLGQAALTGLASLISKECKKKYKRKTKCDDKEGEELDNCCVKHPDADACPHDPCEGKQGEELKRCCTARNSQSVLCRSVKDDDETNVCSYAQIAYDATSCQEKCKNDPALPGCKTLCTTFWHKQICPEVCKTYDMVKCPTTSTEQVCDSGSDHACCTNPNGPACLKWCRDNPASTYCQCVNNKGRCSCDREEDKEHMGDQCETGTTLSSTDCEDPDDPACAVETDGETDVPGLEDGGPPGTTASPFPGPSPFDLDDPLGGSPPPSGGSRPSTGGPGAGPGGGPGGGGGLGGFGGSGGGGSGGEEGSGGEGEGDDPYENILAGLSGNQNQQQGSGGVGGGRGSRAGKGSRSGFDLKKFLPKKKKKKKTAGKKAGRTLASPDNIFDLSSQMMDRYCETNDMNCIRQ